VLVSLPVSFFRYAQKETGWKNPTPQFANFKTVTLARD
jgi:hypothetical protein